MRVLLGVCLVLAPALFVAGTSHAFTRSSAASNLLVRAALVVGLVAAISLFALVFRRTER